MNKTNWGWVLAAGLLTIGPDVGAIFLRSDIERVPVERLIANLEQQIQTNAKNWEPHYALGRVHSMAYALKEETVPISTRSGKLSTSKNNELPPSAVLAAPTPAMTERAQQHLTEAIAAYRQAVELNPDSAESHLGLGWCLAQKAERSAAKESYRKALALAWAKDQRAEHFFYSSLTEEIARYLLALLDSKTDAEEIEAVEGYVQAVRKKPRAVTPILIPLGSDRIELELLVDPKARVQFDLDGSGLPRGWGWLTPDAAWLVFDHDGSGQITSGLQMAGSVMFWIFWENGYQALAALDSNGDGELRGRETEGLALWHDANCNGQSDAGEVQPLSRWGIIALSCRFELHRTGIPYSPAGVHLEAGGVRPSYDWVGRASK